MVREADEPELTSESTVVLDDVLLDESWQLAEFQRRPGDGETPGQPVDGDELAAPALPTSLTTLPLLADPTASKVLALEESMAGAHAGHGGGEVDDGGVLNQRATSPPNER